MNYFLGWYLESTRNATNRAMVDFPSLFVYGSWIDLKGELFFGLYTTERVDLSAFWRLRETFLSNEKGT
mgnify:CR=1 FL=1